MSKTRKSKETAIPVKQATEQGIMEFLLPLEQEVVSQLKKGIENGNFNFIKLYLEYRFGKPGQPTETYIASQNEELHIVIDGKEVEW